MATVGTCIICGFAFGGQENSWSCEYRAIYSSPLGVSVTGVGRHDGSATFIAPLNPAKRWSDPDYEYADEDLIPAMRQPPEHGRHGFVLHEACWLLLEEFFRPNETPILRLLEICESLPFTMMSHGSVCWGHDYGGLWTHDVVHHYPWEEWFARPEVRTGIFEWASKDPFNVPERSSYLASPVCYDLPMEWKPSKPAQNCFSLFPWEVLENVITELSTTDVLGLRLVSTVFQPLLWSSAFWASRFNAGRERDFFFEKRGMGDTAHWLSVYRETSPAVCSLGLRNRQRVWNLIRSLSHITGMHLAVNPVLQLSNTRAWMLVGGLVIDRLSSEPWQPFEEGCYIRGFHIVKIPEDLSKIAFSFCSSGPHGYLTGLRFITSAGFNTCAGFISLQKEVTYEVKELRGFRTAIGARGIRAVQVVHRDGKLSRWFGCPQGFPISGRLSGFNVLGYVKVGFDGYKTVQLGACEREPAYTQYSPAASLPFRQAALWYPDVPSTSLLLNENSFVGESPASTDYRPLFWIHFGGQGGCRLRHITGLSIQYSHCLESIKFLYDDVEATEPAEMLGCDSLSVSMPTFALHGAGGERLESIEVGIRRHDTPHRAYTFVKHGYIVSMKMGTNRGRYYTAGNFSEQDSIKQMDIVEGTIITGLYASKHPEFGMISLGIISETVESENVYTRERG